MTIKNEECVICLDEISGEQVLYFFNNCVHIIHQSCFITCIQIKPFINCPSCRKPILNKKEEDIIFPHISIIIPDNSINNFVVNNPVVNNPVVNNPVVNNPVVNNPVVNNPIVNNPIVNNNEINQNLFNQNDCDENNCIKTQRFCISLFLVIAIVIFLTIRS